MAVQLANNATSRLASSLTTGATTLGVVVGEGARFPSPTGGDWFPVTVIKATGVLEIMRCTARTDDLLTVTRAQESTAAQTFAAGDRVELRMTAATINDSLAQVDTAVASVDSHIASSQAQIDTFINDGRANMHAIALSF